MRTRFGTVGTATLVAVPTLFLGAFFLYPLVRILLVGLAPGGRFTAAPFLRVLTDPRLRRVAWFTLWQASVSTGLTLLVGIPAAYVFARFTFPGKRLLRALTTVPFVLPTLVVGTAFLALLGPNGTLGIDLHGTVWAILVAHVFYNLAIVVRGVGSYWEQIDPTTEEAARVLGAGRWRTFREVTLPLLRPVLGSTAALVFLFTFTSFGVVLVLGGFRNATIEVEIWRQTMAFLRLDVASALALLQLLAVGTILAAYARDQERRAVELTFRAPREAARRPRTPGERLLVGGTLGALALFLGTPLLVLLLRSLRTPSGLGIGNYTSLGTTTTGTLFVPPLEAVTNSLRFALAATLIALVVGLSAAVVVASVRGRTGRAFDTFLMLPLGTSAVTIGFGLLVALDWPIDLRTSLLLVPVAHALVATPFVVRSTLPVLRSIRGRLREAAAVLGASPTRAWREVDLPLTARALLVGAAFAFAVSVGEFGATSFLARPSSPTLPIAIFRLLAKPGAATFGRAMALSVILMLLTATAVLVIESLRLGRGDEF